MSAMPGTVAGPLTPSRRNTVFALIGVGHFMSHLYVLALPPLFALIKADLNISYAALGLMVTVFHVATGASQVPAGFVVDRFGARITLIVGMFVLAGCMGAIGLMETYWPMVALAALAGIGNSVFHPADYAIMANAVDHKHLGKAFSFHLLAGNMGFAAAPVVMVALAAGSDWRTAMLVVGGAGLVCGAAMLLFGQDLRDKQANAPRGSAGNNTGLRALMSPVMLMMLAFFTLVSLTTAGVQTFSVTVLNKVYGVSLESGNTALTVFLTAGFAGVALGGFVADRLRQPVVVVCGAMLVTALSLALVSTVALPLVVLLIAMAIGGAAVGLMRPARDMMVNRIAPAGATGKAFGFMGMGLSIGGAVAPVMFGVMVDMGLASWVLAMCAGFVLLSVATAIAVHRMSQAG